MSSLWNHRAGFKRLNLPVLALAKNEFWHLNANHFDGKGVMRVVYLVHFVSPWLSVSVSLREKCEIYSGQM